MDNPLKLSVLELLHELPLPVSEFDLIQQIKKKLHPFPSLSEHHSVALFQINFLVMNALYTLQDELLQEQLQLSISPLAIDLQSIPPPKNVAKNSLKADSEQHLKEYYFNWSHFKETGEQEVETLLTQFWTRFANQDKTEGAYHTLKLPLQSSWPDIQKAYRTQARQHHPDRGGDPALFIAVRQAYEILKSLHRKSGA